MPENSNSKKSTSTATKKKSTTSTTKNTENKAKVVKKVEEAVEPKKETKQTNKSTTKKTATVKKAETKTPVKAESKTVTKKTSNASKTETVAPKNNKDNLAKPKVKNESKIEKSVLVEENEKVEDKIKEEAKTTSSKTTKKAKTLDEILKNKEETKNKKSKPEPNENIKIEESRKDSMEDTVSLKEIRNALQSKVDENQKRSIIKENIINVMISIAIILYLIIIFTGSKHVKFETLELCLKIFSISFAAIGLVVLEIAYKKDNFKIAISGAEILIFGAINLCMMYVVKLYPSNLMNVTTYISIAVAVYYLVKVVILSIKNVKQFKKDNNDIKEIIKK